MRGTLITILAATMLAACRLSPPEPSHSSGMAWSPLMEGQGEHGGYYLIAHDGTNVSWCVCNYLVDLVAYKVHVASDDSQRGWLIPYKSMSAPKLHYRLSGQPSAPILTAYYQDGREIVPLHRLDDNAGLPEPISGLRADALRLLGLAQADVNSTGIVP